MLTALGGAQTMDPTNRSKLLEDLPLRRDQTVLLESEELFDQRGGRAGRRALRALLLVLLGAAAALLAEFWLRERRAEAPALVLDSSVQRVAPAPVSAPTPTPELELERMRAELANERARAAGLEAQRAAAVEAAARAATDLSAARAQIESHASASQQIETQRQRLAALEQDLARERSEHQETQTLLSDTRGQLSQLQQKLARETERAARPALPSDPEVERLRQELEQERSRSRRSAADLLQAQSELAGEKSDREDAEAELARLRKPARTQEAAAARLAPQPSPVTVPPRLIQSPEVRYPGLARARQLEGDVQVRVLVSTRGEVLEAEIEKSAAGGRLFDQAALQAARACRFEPARQDGHPVESWTRIPIQFRLR
jgi:TonB family protein